MRRLIMICALAVLILAAGSPNSTMATLWTEVGDAGELPGTAQVVWGSGPLLNITGAYTSSNADMYQIYISDPAGFSAYASTPTGDSQLFLFDASGMGVYADDNSGTGLDAYLGTGNVTSGGTHYLAVSGFNNDPYSVGGVIFVGGFDSPPPSGAGAGSPITYWSGTGYSEDYDIGLTGAQHVVPVPGAVLLGILGLSVAGIKLRKSA